MEKRGLLIGNYDTAAAQWTLTEWKLSDPQKVTNFVDVPGRRKGPLDLSTALTDGDPIYGSRELTATFECSEGTRLEREEKISEMVNALDGWRVSIVLPDDPYRYITGSVSVARVYNDLAHASVIVTATCEPWRYNATETTVVLTAAEAATTRALLNSGRLAVVPMLQVSGGEVALTYGSHSWALSPGVYALPDLLLSHGESVITYRGAGTLTITYREAVL
jgi:ribosome-binding factor A